MTAKPFKSQFPLEKRTSEAKRILEKFPDRIPVIVEMDPNCKSLPVLDKHKFLVPIDLTIGQFMYVIRKRIKLTPDKAMYMFFNNSLAPTASTMKSMYYTHKDEDFFLYCSIAAEKTFG
jgi:GABA(A) receptor-associated protein